MNTWSERNGRGRLMSPWRDTGSRLRELVTDKIALVLLILTKPCASQSEGSLQHNDLDQKYHKVSLIAHADYWGWSSQLANRSFLQGRIPGLVLHPQQWNSAVRR